jgi:SpoVK/Ycf46/Vps4 family AAA+-type ATPase
MHHNLTPGDISAVAARTHAFVGADLEALAAEAAMTALRRLVAASSASNRRAVGRTEGRTDVGTRKSVLQTGQVSEDQGETARCVTLQDVRYDRSVAVQGVSGALQCVTIEGDRQ